MNDRRHEAYLCLVLVTVTAFASNTNAEATYPPKLPAGKTIHSSSSKKFLNAPKTIRDDVAVAKTPPTIDFLYYPEQNYPGRPWSVWGDSLTTDGKYYSAIGDHLAPQGNAFVFEYDPDSPSLKTLVNVQKLLDLPEGHYTPGKIHSRIDMGSDGWLYFSTHRGSTRVTTDQYHYEGDWIIRHHPKSGKTETLARGPVPKHCIPTSVLDPERLIFYGGTAAGNRTDPVMFFAYDVKARRVLETAVDGPYRYIILAKSTGRVYYVNQDGGPLMRYDSKAGGPPVKIDGSIGLRSATEETADGFVYTVSTRGDGRIWRFNTKTEEIEEMGDASVGTKDYITSLDVDPTGRFLYYIPGAHGGSQQDGTPIVQFDVKKRTKKVLAFLHPFYKEEIGYVMLGTFASAIDDTGEKLYVTWNGNRGGADRRGRFPFDTCAMTVIHIPESERRP